MIIITSLWYGLMFILPDIADRHGTLALPLSVKSTMIMLSEEHPSYLEALEALDKLGGSKSVYGVTYHYLLSQKVEGGWDLTAEPDRKFVYHHSSWWKRVLFVDFYKHRLYTFQISSGDEFAQTLD